MALQVKKLAYALGAVVTGVDLRAPIGEADASAIKAAWLEHLLLCFPGQNLEGKELGAFAQLFGQPEVLAQRERVAMAVTPIVANMQELPDPGKAWERFNRKNGANWHTDKSYSVQPTLATLLSCKALPPVGGETLFANAYMAYDALSPAMARVLEGLWAVHNRVTGEKFSTGKLAGGETDAQARIREFEQDPPAAHPVVHVHPETHRKAIYWGDRVSQFVGMTEEESAPLVRFISEHCTRYEFTYRHRWTVGDCVVWDNRALMHHALNDYDMRTELRRMLRCSVIGPKSGRLVAEMVTA